MIRSTRSVLVSVAALTSVGICGAGTLAASSPTATPTVASTVPPDDTAPDVGEAGEKSSTAPYRLEMFMEASIMEITLDGDTPLATGEVAGDQSHMTMDFGAMFDDLLADEEMPPELRGIEWVMEIVADGTDLYIRAPFFTALSELGGNDPAMNVFTQLGDGWGYVDSATVPGVDAGSMSGTMGIGGADPAALFALLADVEGAESIGTADIRGVSTTGVRAEVNLAELLEAQGTPVTATGNPFGDATFPIEVWIDKDGFVRRIVMDLNADAIAEAAEASGEEVPASMIEDMDMSVTMEMFDYNAADIAIEVPTKFIDITDDFAELLPPQGG